VGPGPLHADAMAALAHRTPDERKTTGGQDGPGAHCSRPLAESYASTAAGGTSSTSKPAEPSGTRRCGRRSPGRRCEEDEGDADGTDRRSGPGSNRRSSGRPSGRPGGGSGSADGTNRPRGSGTRNERGGGGSSAYGDNAPGTSSHLQEGPRRRDHPGQEAKSGCSSSGIEFDGSKRIDASDHGDKDGGRRSSDNAKAD
jgi:hypothetical protein